MEKKHQPSYHSYRILGRLYDKVDSVDFCPQWKEPFDKRILRAYQLDDRNLYAARQVKSEYDMAMRRIMAQQEINTEFEVWSTFVLSRPRVGSDYKVQEAMAVISNGLKEQFRATCIERAGCTDGKDFSKLGPFVAAMYKVTKEELDIALAECRMTKMVDGQPRPKRMMQQKTMPLISFPWLFEKELGRIATDGIGAEGDLLGLGLPPLNLKNHGQVRKRHGGGTENLEDFIQQEDGVIVHRGEELDLFRSDVQSDDLSGESDFEQTPSSVMGDDPNIVGESGEAVLDTTSPVKPTLVDLLSGTSIEDTEPRTQLDRPLDPREAQAHNSGQEPSYGRPSVTLTPPPSSRNPAVSPATAPLSPSVADASILDQSIPQEEEVHLDLEETSLEKLARMMGSSN
jgi:RNA-dependent RNA polymerase